MCICCGRVYGWMHVHNIFRTVCGLPKLTITNICPFRSVFSFSICIQAFTLTKCNIIGLWEFRIAGQVVTKLKITTLLFGKRKSCRNFSSRISKSQHNASQQYGFWTNMYSHTHILWSSYRMIV